MKVHLVKWKSIENFIVDNARSKASFERFKTAVKGAGWESVNDLQDTFGSADLINNDWVVLNIGGNNYRLICSY